MESQSVNPQLANLLIGALYLVILAVVVRSILAWFRGAADSGFSRLLFECTEPLLAPIRRVMPRSSTFDASPTAAIVLLYVLVALISRAAAA